MTNVMISVVKAGLSKYKLGSTYQVPTKREVKDFHFFAGKTQFLAGRSHLFRQKKKGFFSPTSSSPSLYPSVSLSRTVIMRPFIVSLLNAEGELSK
jgi:hypothetical protein